MIYISQHNNKESLEEFLRYLGRFDGTLFMGDGIVAQIENHEARQDFKDRYYNNDKKYWIREYETKVQRHAEYQKLSQDMWFHFMSKKRVNN